MWLRSRVTVRLLFLFGVIGLGGMLFGALAFLLRPRKPLPPLKVSLWYWHQPFRVSNDEAVTLREMGVDTLFVRAGTITRDHDSGSLYFVIPQTWATRADGFRVNLVFNADYGVIRQLDTITDGALRTAFSSAIKEQSARARLAGINVDGVQLDFDCPTRLLPRYATLLAGLRADLRASGTKGTFSITALPTWLTSPDLQAVANQVDFIVPQFYESDIPRTLDTFATISSEARLRRGLERAGRLSTPFWAGIPSYGHALVFDGNGRLRGAFHDAGVLDMVKQPYFRIDRIFPANSRGVTAASAADFIGENIVEVGPTGIGAPDQTDFHLIYDLPTPTLVMRQLACVRDNRPPNCAGVILYRYPEHFPTDAVPLTALASVLKGKTPKPHLKILVFSRAYAPWRGIEGGEDAEGPSRNVFVSVTNDGDGSAGVAPNAVVVDVRFAHPGFREIAAGGFDTAEAFAAAPGNRASSARADGIRMTTLHLAPGQQLIGGPFRVSTDNAVSNVSWNATGDGAFATYRGDIEIHGANPTVQTGASPAPSPLKRSK